MTAMRKIFKSATTAQHAVRDVLAMVFAQELLAPSRDVFVVAPWISNIVVFDNSLGQFGDLNPEWGMREVRLIDVFVALASSGAQIHIHTRPELHNRAFERRLLEALSDTGVSDQCLWAQQTHLHTKGLLTDSVLIDGSMNLTEYGVALNDELVNVYFDAPSIAGARIYFDSYERT